MGRDFFQTLPSELTTDILSRLPLRSVSISKCVCKSWLNLLKSDDFELKTPPALVCLKGNASRCAIFELEDEADLESHDLQYVPLTDFHIRHGSQPMGCTAANGLLLLYTERRDVEYPVYVCNPLTRQYIVLCHPKKYALDETVFYFDFCVSEISGQYKVVCITQAGGSHYCHVYTLGTGIWRRVETGVASGFTFCYLVQHAACNGNLHWTVDVLDRPCFRICGFDVETECFSIFSPPSALTLLEDRVDDLYLVLNVVRDCLCFCYTEDYEIIIWLMKEYRVEESWSIEYKLSTIGFDIEGGWVNNFVCPIKVFKDGDVLMILDGEDLIYYSHKTRTTQHVCMFNDADEEDYAKVATIFTPSLFNLKSFGLENVISF